MQSRNAYPSAFRQDAVQVVTEPGMSRTQVARDLGLNPDTLRRWRKHETALPAATEPATPRRAALARLRREHAQLPMARASLRHAIGSCARIPQ